MALAAVSRVRVMAGLGGQVAMVAARELALRETGQTTGVVQKRLSSRGVCSLCSGNASAASQHLRRSSRSSNLSGAPRGGFSSPMPSLPRCCTCRPTTTRTLVWRRRSSSGLGTTRPRGSSTAPRRVRCARQMLLRRRQRSGRWVVTCFLNEHQRCPRRRGSSPSWRACRVCLKLDLKR